MPNYYYNGVELPDINEVWTDKVTYPYARISANDYGVWSVALLPEPIVLGSGQYCKMQYYELGTYGVSEGKWRRIGDDYMVWSDSQIFNLQWSNHDILNADGSVYFPKSEAILLYTLHKKNDKTLNRSQSQRLFVLIY